MRVWRINPADISSDSLSVPFWEIPGNALNVATGKIRGETVFATALLAPNPTVKGQYDVIYRIYGMSEGDIHCLWEAIRFGYGLAGVEGGFFLADMNNDGNDELITTAGDRHVLIFSAHDHDN